MGERPLILKTEGLCKTYKIGSVTVKALDKIDLSIEEGAFVSIIGKSGCGKSTLLNLLGGLDSPSSGKVFVDGVDIYSQSEKDLSVFRRKRLGFVFQFFNLIPELSLKENIVFPVSLDKKEYDQKYFQQLIEMLELQDRLDHLPSQLSGGQQQRAAIARAFMSKPSIIFMDEPTGNLDQKSAKSIVEGIRRIQKEFNQTILIVTHDMDISKATDRIISISDGKLE